MPLTFRSPSEKGVIKWGDAGFKREPGRAGKAAHLERKAATGAGADGQVVGADHRRCDGTPTNQTVYLTAFPPADHLHARELTVETRDPCDRAHGVVNPEGLHYSGKGRRYRWIKGSRDQEIKGSSGDVHGDLAPRSLGPSMPRSLDPSIPSALGTPRRYPPSQMTSTGVSIDSAFDGLHMRLERLQGQGVNTTRDFGDNAHGLCASSAMIGAVVARLKPGQEIRKIINRHQKTEPGTASAEAVIAAFRRGEWSPVL